MDKKKIIRDLSFLKKRKDILGILLYGSHAKREATKRSDIDVCIVAPKCKDKFNLRIKALGHVGDGYDIHIFENFPLYIKVDVLNNHKVLWAKSRPELGEYFYFIKKHWLDQSHRQKITKSEMKEILERRISKRIK